MTTEILKRQLANPEIKTFIIEAVQEILTDPDFGLGLTARARKRLQLASRPAKKTISLPEIKKKYC